MFNALKNIFGSASTRAVCPICMGTVAATAEQRKCTGAGCGNELPALYVENYEEAPPLFLPMIGLPNAGKTTFLTATSVALVRATEFWQSTHWYPLTDKTDDFIEKAKQAMANGVMPASTVKMAAKDAYILQVNAVPRWGNFTWVARDVAGEDFSSRTFDSIQLPFLRNARTAFLFHDFNAANELAGNEKEAPRTVDAVLRGYILGLKEKGVRFEARNPRNLVVVLTKADQLALPHHLKDYLWDDEHSDSVRRRALTKGKEHFDDAGMAAYMERLRYLDGEIGDWVKTRPGGKDLFNLAAPNHIRLHFCLASINKRKSDVSKIRTYIWSCRDHCFGRLLQSVRKFHYFAI